MKRLFIVILVLLAACAPAATETLASIDLPATEIPTQIPPTEIPPTAIPPTVIPTPEPLTPIPTPEAAPFAVNPESVIDGLTVKFTAPDNMTCDLYVLGDFPNILSIDPVTCLPSSPINNFIWGKLMNEQDEIIPLKCHADSLDFLNTFLQANVYAANELGFGIDPQDTPDQQQYAPFDLHLDGTTYTVILWLNALEPQREIIADSKDNDTNEGTNINWTLTAATPPPTGCPGGCDD